MVVAILVAALFLVLSLWYGWSIGLPCMLCEIAGGIAGLGLGWLLGPSLAPLLRSFVQAPDIVLAVLAGLILAVIVFVLVKVTSMVFLKSTKHHHGLLKFLFGATGGILGVITAIVLLCCSVLAIRELGCLLAGTNTKHKGIEARVSELSQAMENSLIGPALGRIQPLTGSFCETVRKVEKVFRDEKRVERFFELPEAKTLFSDPKLMVLMQDEALRNRLREKRLLEVFSDRNVIAALNDPNVLRKLAQFEWDRALDHALGTEPSEGKE